jgi:hypothetical protein
MLMPAALLAFLLLAATVDPRLVEPLRLLAEVGARDARTLGSFYARVPDALSLTLAVRPLPDGTDARYDRRHRTVTVAELVLAEDARIVAVVLAHELRHAADLEWVVQGAVTLDCLEFEARGFEAEAIVARAFWPDVLPDGTDRERDLAAIVEGYERGGIGDIRARLEAEVVYRDECTREGQTAAGRRGVE